MASLIAVPDSRSSSPERWDCPNVSGLDNFVNTSDSRALPSGAESPSCQVLIADHLETILLPLVSILFGLG